jgi:hypothetical protein
VERAHAIETGHRKRENTLVPTGWFCGEHGCRASYLWGVKDR